MLLLILCLLGGTTLTASAQSQTSTSFVLYIDADGNGQMDWHGPPYDICVRSNNDGSMLSWVATRQSNGIGYLIYTPYNYDFQITSQSNWQGCFDTGRVINVPSNNTYILTGCGGFTDSVYITALSGYGAGKAAHRVSATEPGC